MRKLHKLSLSHKIAFFLLLLILVSLYVMFPCLLLQVLFF